MDKKRQHFYLWGRDDKNLDIRLANLGDMTKQVFYEKLVKYANSLSSNDLKTILGL